jgi:GT2 family glycosyltransferase
VEKAANHNQDVLTVVIVSANSARWLPGCLSSLRAHAGALPLDVVVVDSDSADGTVDVVARFPGTRLVRCANHGFAHGNNRGVETSRAEWVLLLNPDTEFVAGTLQALVTAAERHARGAIFGVRQVWPDGRLQYSIRRFPTAARLLGQALGSEAWPVHPAWAGERELDETLYRVARRCDWTTGSCLLVRRSVWEELGGMDERFFLYSEEPDLCLRARQRGWETWHLPTVTVIHHGGGSEANSPSLAAQLVTSKRLYLEKHAGLGGRVAGVAALALGLVLRAVLGSRRGAAAPRRNALTALAALLGLRPPPFAELTVGHSSGD